MLKTAIATAVQPLRDDIDLLKQVDRRHSGAHKDLSTNVRQSLVDIQVAKEATIATVDQKLDAFRSEMRAERAAIVKAPEAAEAAQKAAIQASTSAAAVSFDTAQIRSKQEDNAHNDRIRFWVTLIPVIITALFEAWQKLGH